MHESVRRSLSGNKSANGYDPSTLIDTHQYATDNEKRRRSRLRAQIHEKRSAAARHERNQRKRFRGYGPRTPGWAQCEYAKNDSAHR